jgi:excinuclease ABC subunit A
MAHDAKIELEGVRVNNLKAVSTTIPHGQWLSICGLSGSGKSSLAFDTLFAEGQRRYIESLSIKTRQFVQQLDRPNADRISGLPPAVAIRAPRGSAGPRSTLGTATEIDALLRLLFAKVADAYCPKCGKQITRDNQQTATDWFANLPAEKRAIIAWPILGDADLVPAIADAIRDGFVRAIVGEQMIDLAEFRSAIKNGLRHDEANQVLVVADRLKTGTEESRVNESFESAFYCGDGNCCVFFESDDANCSIDGRPFECRKFSVLASCPSCDFDLPELEPRLFSMSNADSVCPTCKGSGCIEKSTEPCYACAGTRFQIPVLAFRVADHDFAKASSLSVSAMVRFAESLRDSLSVARLETVTPILNQMAQRLNYLSDVGLQYLTLNRSLRSLSSGERQRVLLTSVLGTSLVNMLFVLDEPSIGLHADNVERLTQIIKQLNHRGNTLAVVDHDEAVIRAADRILEIGPNAGMSGGEIVFDGTLDEILVDEESITGQYLSGRRGQSCGQETRRKSHRRMKLIGASGHNLKNINVEFPLGVLCAVTGVSGAGKTTLVQNTLYGAVSRKLAVDVDGTLPFEEIHGADWVSEIVLVDASPIGRSSRSNPVTYVKAFSDIRNAFAETADANRLGFGPGKFSFNVAGGRCEKCRGDGQLSLTMQFMADIWVTCDQCDGKRYRDDVLSVRYRDRTIAQVLSMTVREAFGFFRGHPAVQSKLKALIDVGLEYIQLGQPANTLSSGESQRLKIAQYLNTAKNRRVLFIMDQPTAGLHSHDIIRLLDCFNSLISVGHSMIVVEHNLSFIKHADWLIDLGPGAGELGGNVVAAGTPEDVAACEDSITGRYLTGMIHDDRRLV